MNFCTFLMSTAGAPPAPASNMRYAKGTMSFSLNHNDAGEGFLRIWSSAFALLKAGLRMGLTGKATLSFRAVVCLVDADADDEVTE